VRRGFVSAQPVYVSVGRVELCLSHTVHERFSSVQQPAITHPREWWAYFVNPKILCWWMRYFNPVGRQHPWDVPAMN